MRRGDIFLSSNVSVTDTSILDERDDSMRDDVMGLFDVLEDVSNLPKRQHLTIRNVLVNYNRSSSTGTKTNDSATDIFNGPGGLFISPRRHVSLAGCPVLYILYTLYMLILIIYNVCNI